MRKLLTILASVAVLASCTQKEEPLPPSDLHYYFPELKGSLVEGVKSDAVVVVKYRGANGTEELEVNCKITGEASKGLSADTYYFTPPAVGGGEIEIPIDGTPSEYGPITIQVSIYDDLLEPIETEVSINPDASIIRGFPVEWDFFAAGCKTAADAKANPAAKDWFTSRKLYPTAGKNSKAVLTPVGVALEDVTLEPAIGAKGFLKGDYFLATIPVKNIKPTHRLNLTATAAGSAASASRWIIEYSSDAKTWFRAEGAHESKDALIDVGVEHFRAGEEAKSYIFPLYGISDIPDGNLYVRLKVCINQRVNGPKVESAAIGASSISCIKGISIKLENEEAEPKTLPEKKAPIAAPAEKVYKVVSHRCGAWDPHCPAEARVESSEAAILYSIGLKCFAVETDMVLTKDNQILMYHPDYGCKVNGLVTFENTFDQINAVGPAYLNLQQFLAIILDKSKNPCGTRVWLDCKRILTDWPTGSPEIDVRHTIRCIYKALEIIEEMGAQNYVDFLIPTTSSYAEIWQTVRPVIIDEYGCSCRWMTHTTPDKYYNGAAQINFDKMIASNPGATKNPEAFFAAGVPLSIYNTDDSLDAGFYNENFLKQYYSRLTAVFGNRPYELIELLISAGLEQRI